MGDENEFAYNAALQVANGNKDSYNPLFIYGKSGLGKTHLLRAIQNYIVTNDPSRICVYRDASQFINEYVGAMREAGSAADALRRNYEDIDVLIIDDVQGLAGKAGTITFFFNIFNTLKSNGKQVVIAADRTPAELGMGKDGFDERVTSRIGGGFTVSVQVPSYELKLRLIGTFCDRMREDSAREHVGEPPARDSRAPAGPHGRARRDKHPHHRGLLPEVSHHGRHVPQAGQGAHRGRRAHHSQGELARERPRRDHRERAEVRGEGLRRLT